MWDDFVGGQISNVTASTNYEQQLIATYKKHCKGTYNGPEVYKMMEGRVYSLSDELTHLCTPFCKNHPRWCNAQCLTNKITNIYISNYMKIHICSETCDGKKEYSDGFQTCTLTGLRYQCTNWVNSYKRLHEYHRTSSTTVRVETTALQECAKKVIHCLLFSTERQRIERKKIFDLKKDVQKTWIKHKRQRDKKKETINVIEMITMASNIIKKKISKKYILPEKETQDLIINFYTDRVCEFYLKLKTLTNFTTYNTQQHVGDAFCTAVLFMMRSGLRINDFDVIAKDYFLDVILPEANCLDHFKVNKTVSLTLLILKHECTSNTHATLITQQHFTTYRNHISAGIRDAIHIYYINPNKLMLCSLQE